MKFLAPALTAAALILLPVSSVVAQQGKLLEVPVGKTFARGEINWDTNLGRIGFAWAVLDVGGAAHVCGATSASTSFAHRNTRAAFRKAWVKQGATKIMTDLAYFTRAPRGSDLGSVKALCKPLAGGAAAGKRFQLGFDPVKVRN